MEMIFVKPVEGRRCKDPNTRDLLPECGRNVVKNSYWLKRLDRGDCVLAERISVKKVVKEESSFTSYKTFVGGDE